MFLHVLRAHLQTILAKAADQQAPPEIDITKYGWEIKDELPAPVISDHPPGPQNLMDVVRCGCKALGKACSSEICSCHHDRISCTVYCACKSGTECYNPHKTSEDDDEGTGTQSDTEGDNELV